MTPSCPELPPGALDGVARAVRRYDELAAEDREVHFALVDGHLRIEVRDLRGATLRTLSAAEAVAVADGAAP
jgi:hypothetical protein